MYKIQMCMKYSLKYLYTHANHDSRVLIHFINISVVINCGFCSARANTQSHNRQRHTIIHRCRHREIHIRSLFSSLVSKYFARSSSIFPQILYSFIYSIIRTWWMVSKIGENSGVQRVALKPARRAQLADSVEDHPSSERELDVDDVAFISVVCIFMPPSSSSLFDDFPYTRAVHTSRNHFGEFSTHIPFEVC